LGSDSVTEIPQDNNSTFNETVSVTLAMTTEAAANAAGMKLFVSQEVLVTFGLVVSAFGFFANSAVLAVLILARRQYASRTTTNWMKKKTELRVENFRTKMTTDWDSNRPRLT